MKSIEDNEVFQTLKKTRLLPLYTVHDMHLLPIVESILVDNNIPIIEVALRSEYGMNAIKVLTESSRLLVGAGTVRTVEEAEKAIECGARFVVSPAVIPEVIEYCITKKVPIFPGTATPTDIQKAASYGLRTVKFFPAGVYGGTKAIKALCGPFYDMKFLPTGGVNEQNFVEFLENQQVLGVGGSFILSESVVAKDNGKSANDHLKEIVHKLSKCAY